MDARCFKRALYAIPGHPEHVTTVATSRLVLPAVTSSKDGIVAPGYFNIRMYGVAVARGFTDRQTSVAETFAILSRCLRADS